MHPHLTGAAGTAVRDLVIGPLRTGRIVAAPGAAVYLQLDPVDGRAATPPGVDVVALLDRDAVRVPIGVVLATPLPSPRPAVGAPASVGGGSLRVPGVEVEVTRWWRSDPLPARRVPCEHAGAAGAPGDHRPTVPDAWLPPDVAPAATALRSALHRGSPAEPPARALLGLGPGLTPAGDDVLAGALVALHHHDDPRGAQLAAAVVPLLHRTTTVSAALLRQAVLGRAVPELAAFVAALACAGPGVHGSGAHLCGAAGVQQDVLRRLLAVGSTSGACLAFGALAVPPQRRPPDPARPVEVW